MCEYDEQQQAIKDAAAEFSGTFGLRAFPGEVFCIELSACYWAKPYCKECQNPDDREGEGTKYTGPMLYTYIKRGDELLSFSKGSPAELRREIVRV